MKLSWFLLTLLGSVVLTSAAEASSLQNWRFNRDQNKLEIQTAQGVQPRARLLANPTRLVIDLPGVNLARPRQTEAIGGEFRSLRIAQFDPNTTRIVIELAPGYTLDPQKVEFKGNYANQWTVQLPAPQRIGSDDAAEPETPTSTNDNKPAEMVLIVPLPERRQLSPAAPGTALAPTNRPPLPLPGTPNSRIVVVIDPGHGGPDPGAIGIGGLREVDVIMPISLQVANLLQEKGIQVILTREDDRDLGLEPRVQIANRANATLFVSIHANAISMSRPDVNGAETFYHVSGKELAAAIQRNIVELTGMRDRGVKRARFYVLNRTRMPSALVEVGFVTGAQDAPRLADPEFRNKLAEAIARGILQYVRVGS